jgi:hypothetical protein
MNSEQLSFLDASTPPPKQEPPRKKKQKEHKTTRRSEVQVKKLRLLDEYYGTILLASMLRMPPRWVEQTCKKSPMFIHTKPRMAIDSTYEEHKKRIFDFTAKAIQASEQEKALLLLAELRQIL